jgi:hypothetical protein
VWNAENADHFNDRKVKPLDLDTIGRHAELARQPLLLALLALYDAEDNGLRTAGDISQPELYERIFRRYLERELEKHDLPVRIAERNQLIEQRFRELSTIATGMLNRGRRFVTRHEVDHDLAATGVRRDPSSATPIRADYAVGQFFFLYRAQARHGESTFNEGYEFIHATFGEFLSARIIAYQLVRAAEVTRLAPAWERPASIRHARSLLIPYLCATPPLITKLRRSSTPPLRVSVRVTPLGGAWETLLQHKVAGQRARVTARETAEGGRAGQELN